jgi:UrcA family protein
MPARHIHTVKETLMTTGLSRTLGIAAETLALGVATAQAAPETDAAGPPAVHVRYHDLNLASPDGVHTLCQRIVAAARELCPVGRESPVHFVTGHACQAQAIERAVHEVHDQRLAVLHARLAGTDLCADRHVRLTCLDLVAPHERARVLQDLELEPLPGRYMAIVRKTSFAWYGPVSTWDGHENHRLRRGTVEVWNTHRQLNRVRHPADQIN